jgi:RNA polymerase sigma-70 factor (ECF subfamily)
LQVVDWQAVVEKHGPIVWQTTYRLLGNHADAADCFQEAFVGALEISRRQRVRSFPALLVRLATARAIDKLRQRVRRPNCHVDSADLATLPSTTPEPVQQAEQHELAARLRNALGQLAPQESQAFCLRYFNDMNYRQIAEELGMETNAMGVMLHRAKAKLRDYLQLSP